MADSQNIYIEAQSRRSVGELNRLADMCDDRDTARGMYDAISNLLHKISRKHNFSLTRKRSQVKSAESVV